MNGFIDLACCILKFGILWSMQMLLLLFKSLKHLYYYFYLPMASLIRFVVIISLQFFVQFGCYLNFFSSILYMFLFLSNGCGATPLMWNEIDKCLTMNWPLITILQEKILSASSYYFEEWNVCDSFVVMIVYVYCSTVFIVWKHCGCLICHFQSKNKILKDFEPIHPCL